MDKTMFKMHGLYITGTQEQIDKYATNEKEFDYLKRVMEMLYSEASKASKNKGGLFFSTANIKSDVRLVALNDQNEDVTFLVYDIKTNAMTKATNIRNLLSLKNDLVLDAAMFDMSDTRDDLIDTKIFQSAFALYHEQINDDVKTKDNTYHPQLISNTKYTLTSQSGFYVGDPSLVLPDDILNRGIRNNGKINTGNYHVGNYGMMIMNAKNGCHSGHNVYSGTMAVIPLELIDKNKIKALGDDVDIRLGQRINLIAKENRLFLAQGEIDEINMMVEDTVHQEYRDNGLQF